MKVKFLRMSNLLLVGVMTLMGLSACKKEPSSPDTVQITPCYGVIPTEYCEMTGNEDEAMTAPVEVQTVLNNED